MGAVRGRSDPTYRLKHVAPLADKYPERGGLVPRYYRLGVVTVYQFLGERFLVPLRAGFAASLADRRLRSEKRKSLEDARRYAHRGARDKAVNAYQGLIHADPSDARARLELGDILRRWGRVPEAITQYTSLVEQYRSEGFEERAVALLKQILSLDSRRYSAYVSLSELYEEMGLDAEATYALQVAIDGLQGEGRMRDALELLRRVSKLNPENTESRIKVADQLRQAGMFTDAVSEFEAIIDELLRVRSQELLATVYERILEIQPGNVAILLKMTSALRARGECWQAEALALRAAALMPTEPQVFEELIAIYEAVDAKLELADAARTLAGLYRERGDEDHARDISQRWPADVLEPVPSFVAEGLGPGFSIGGEGCEGLDFPEEDAFGSGKTALFIEASSEPVDEVGERAESAAPAEPARGRGPAEELSLALDLPTFVTGQEFVPDRKSFAAGPPLLEIADPKEQAAAAMQSMVDVAVGGALATECPIALLIDEEDGETLELDLGDPLDGNGHEDSLDDPHAQDLPALNLESPISTSDEFFEPAVCEDLEAQVDSGPGSEGLPLLLSDEELAGSESGTGHGGSTPRD